MWSTNKIYQWDYNETYECSSVLRVVSTFFSRVSSIAIILWHTNENQALRYQITQRINISISVHRYRILPTVVYLCRTNVCVERVSILPHGSFSHGRRGTSRIEESRCWKFFDALCRVENIVKLSNNLLNYLFLFCVCRTIVTHIRDILRGGIGSFGRIFGIRGSARVGSV